MDDNKKKLRVRWEGTDGKSRSGRIQVALREHKEDWGDILRGFDLADEIEHHEDLRGIDLRGVDFAQVDLSYAHLQHAHLDDSILARAKLQFTVLDDATLSGCEAIGADFLEASLLRCDFTKADLSTSILSGANCQRAQFDYAILSHAFLSLANMSEASLRNADLGGSDLSGANLSGADLRGANFDNADLRGANLDNADLRGVDLRLADLRGVDQTSVKLTAADHRAGLAAAYGQRNVAGRREVENLAKLQHSAMSCIEAHANAIAAADFNEAQKQLAAALDFESRAARCAPGDMEPTRSVLFWSAASIAMRVGDLSVAGHLIAEGLRGKAPVEIRDELIELLEVLAERQKAIASETQSHLFKEGQVVQELRLHKEGSKIVYDLPLVSRLQELWTRIYSFTLEMANRRPAILVPLRSGTGSYRLQLRVKAPNENAKRDAFEALATLGNLAANDLADVSNKTLARSRMFLALLSQLQEWNLELEVRMYRFGEDAESELRVLFATPSSERVQQLRTEAAGFVDSEDIPQANEITRVFTFVEILNKGDYPTPAQLDVGARQVNYYRRATEILGYYRDKTLTPAGLLVAVKKPDEQLRSAVAQFEASAVGSAWVRWAKGSGLRDVNADSALEFLTESAAGLSKATIARRAKTLRAWRLAMESQV